MDFGDPGLEGFASFARLLRKRLKGLSAEQVDLGDLRLTHFKVSAKDQLDGINASRVVVYELLKRGQVGGLFGASDHAPAP